MKTWILGVASVGLLLLGSLQNAKAGTITWQLLAGSQFYDASTNTMQQLSGTIVTETAQPSGFAGEFAYHIDSFNITGSTRTFLPASFGAGTLFVGGTLFTQSSQLIIGNPDSARFFGNNPGDGTWSRSFTGTADNALTITEINMHAQDGFTGPSALDIQTSDRLTLVLGNTSISSAPEPASLTLLSIGIAGMAGYSWRRRNLRTTI